MTTATHALPVETIEGIGESFGARLRDAGITTVLELAAARTDTLARVAELPTDGDRPARWRSAARLMLLAGVSAQLAEALVRSGIRDTTDLASSRLSELRPVFESALNDQIIPEVPTDDALCAMIRDAAVSANTGQLSGRVETADGSSLSGARVELGQHSTSADESGRFHLDRIPLGRQLVLRITAATGEALIVEKPHLVRDPLALRLQRFRLPGSGEPARVPRLYNELSGDRLPQVSAPLRIVRSSRARFGDVLRVSRIDEAKRRAVLVSLFRSFYEGCYYADSFRVSLDELPDGAAVGLHLKVTAAGLEPVEMTPAVLLRTKLALQALAMVRDDPEDSEERRVERRKERNRVFVRLVQNASREDQP